jgi:hypothetical protein
MLGTDSLHPLAKHFRQLTSTSQLAEQYGEDVASEVLARSRSNVNLHDLAEPYASGAQVHLSPFDSKQDTPQRAS